jgi:hydrogenase-4 component B
VTWPEVIAVAGGLSLLAGVAAPVAPRGLAAALSAQTAGVLLLGVAGAAVLFGHDPVGAGFRSEIAPALGIDALSGFFLVVLALAAIPATVYARAYLRPDRAGRAVASLTALFLLALIGLVTARDPLGLLAFWELMTLVPATAMLVARRDAPVRSAVLTYLAITHLGGAGVWIALLTLAHHGAIGDPAALAAQGGGVQALVAIAALVGFGTKAGLVPLHSWLPQAHPVAPSHLSALMSGVMIKLALYGLIRVEFEWLGSTPVWLGVTLVAVGVVTALGGALWALVQGELKRVLAYSSVENVGIVVCGLGASMLFAAGSGAGAQRWAAIAFAAALLHVASHAVAKTLLFLAAGAFERTVGGLDLDRIGGLLRRMPWIGGAFLAGTMAIAGLPLLSGFASEWLTLQSLLHLAMEEPLGVALVAATALAALAATAAFALLCFVQVAGLVLLGPPRRPEVAAAGDAPIPMRVGIVALAALCVALGLVPGLLVPTLAGLAPGDVALVRHVGLDIPGTGSLPTVALVVGIGLLVALLTAARGSRSASPAPTWACGQQLAPGLRWTSAGFTKPVRLVLEALLRPHRELEVEADGAIVQRVSYTTEVRSLVDRALVEPAVRAGLRGAAVARRLQTGNVRTYAAYLLGLVLALLALVRLGALT